MNQNKSIHWTHQCALLDRVYVPEVNNKDNLREVQFISLLPCKQVQERLMWRMAVLVSRVVTKYLDAFKPMKDAVHYHIPHQYSKEMEQKSVSCSLGVEFFNSNIAGEMAQLMQKNQSNYVPLTPDGNEAETVPFHGDQLFEERSRNVKWTFQDGESSMERLEGLEPEFADWHAKFTLYKAENKLFVNHDSAGEIGTSMASINRTSKSNAAKDAHNHINEYSEFHSREMEAHICAAFMEHVNTDNMDVKPDVIIPDNYVSLSTRQKWLKELCYQFVGKYVFNSNDILGLVDKTADLEQKSKPPYQCRVQHCDKTYQFHSVRVRHEIQIHNFTVSHYEGDERDTFGYYFCRCGCNLVFSTKATRNRHESKDHKEILNLNEAQEPAAQGDIELLFDDDSKTENKIEIDDNDYILNYHQAKLSFGLVLCEFIDAVKEGDGDHLFDLYKLCLLIFKSLGHTKYAYVVLVYLVKISFFLSEREAFRLKWNRFYNHHGGKGKNISLDLRKEQQNLILKKMWKSLGPNLNEKSAKRISESLDLHEMLIASVDKDCNLNEKEGYRSNPKQEEAVHQITKDLVDNKVFHFTRGREGYQSFPNFDSNIVKLDYRDLHKWIKDRLKLWKSIYN